MAEKQCNLIKNGGDTRAIIDTIAYLNVDWSNPTNLFVTTATGDYDFDWVATDDGFVVVTCNSHSDHCVELYVYDASNNTHFLWAVGNGAHRSATASMYVKKGVKYRFTTRMSSTAYSGYATFFPMINDIFAQ